MVTAFTLLTGKSAANISLPIPRCQVKEKVFLRNKKSQISTLRVRGIPKAKPGKTLT
jgi:hypothetical protein